MKAEPGRRVSIADALRPAAAPPSTRRPSPCPDVLRQRKTTRATHSAVFVEVKIDEDFGMVHVTRVVSAVAAGRIVNPRTAENQIRGAVVWGIGQALHEEAQLDHRFGRVMNANFGEYHVATHADVGEIDVIFVHEDDAEVNPLGVKGVGEIGIVGVAAAIANAVFHATGRRVREPADHPRQGARPGRLGRLGAIRRRPARRAAPSPPRAHATARRAWR